MNTAPTTLENNRPIAQGAWSVTKYDIVDSDFSLERPQQVLCFYLSLEHLQRGARTFSDFDFSKPASVSHQAMFHAILRCVDSMWQMYLQPPPPPKKRARVQQRQRTPADNPFDLGNEQETENANDNNSNTGGVDFHSTKYLPIEMFLEPVLEDVACRRLDEDEEQHVEAIFDALQQNGDLEQAKRQRQRQRDEASAASMASSLNRSRGDERAFMAGFEDRVVLGYRLHVYVMADFGRHDFSHQFKAMLKENEIFSKSLKMGLVSKCRPEMHRWSRRDQRALDATLQSQTLALQASSGNGMVTAIASPTDHFADHESFRRIDSIDVWLNMCDAYIQHKYFTTQQMRVRAYSTETAMERPENPANPINVLLTSRAFELLPQQADTRQSQLAEYWDADTDTWTFPYPQLVLRIKECDQNTLGFHTRFLPHYYVTQLYNTIDWSTFRGRSVRNRELAASATASLSSNGSNLSFLDHRLASSSTLVNNAQNQVQDQEQEQDQDQDDGLLDFLDDSVTDVEQADNGEFDDDISRRLHEINSRQVVTTGDTTTTTTTTPLLTSSTSSDRLLTSSSLTLNDMVQRRANCPPMRQDLLRVAPLYDEAQLGLSDNFYTNRRDPSMGSGDTVLGSGSEQISGRSALHRLRIMHARERADLESRGRKQTQEQRRVAYRLFQSEALKNFVDRCTSPGANVSRPMQAVNAWFERHYQSPLLTHCNTPLDPSLSVFANRIAKLMLQFEHRLDVAHCHKLLLHTLYAAYDAFRYGFDLHYNVIMAGPFATSKSFILNSIQQMLIADTSHRVTYESKKANAVDVDCNDEVRIFEELPGGMVQSKGKGSASAASADNEQVTFFKERLTSQQTSAKVIYCRPDGFREQRTTRSESMGCYIGATNDELDGMDPAIRSRFAELQALKRSRPNASVSDKKAQASDRSDHKRRALNRFLAEQQVNHFYHCIIEKLIMTHVLRDVDLGCFSILRPSIESGLRKINVKLELRATERIKLFVRRLVIENAIQCVFHSPQSPWTNKPFQWRSLLDVEPLLHDTEEIVMFVYDLLAEQLMEENGDHVVRQMHNLVRRALDEQGEMRVFAHNHAEAASLPYVQAVEPDREYLKLGTNISRMTRTIASLTESHDITLTAEQVRRRLQQMCSSYVDSPGYEMVLLDAALGTRALRALPPGAQKPRKVLLAFRQIVQGHTKVAEFFVHASVVQERDADNEVGANDLADVDQQQQQQQQQQRSEQDADIDDSTPMLRILQQSCSQRYSDAQRRYLLASAMDHSHPHVLQTMSLQPNLQRSFSTTHAAVVTNGTTTQQDDNGNEDDDGDDDDDDNLDDDLLQTKVNGQRVFLRESVDLYAVRRRMASLHIAQTPGNVKLCTVQHYETQPRQLTRQQRRRLIDYPAHFCSNNTASTVQKNTTINNDSVSSSSSNISNHSTTAAAAAAAAATTITTPQFHFSTPSRERTSAQGSSMHSDSDDSDDLHADDVNNGNENDVSLQKRWQQTIERRKTLEKSQTHNVLERLDRAAGHKRKESNLYPTPLSPTHSSSAVKTYDEYQQRRQRATHLQNYHHSHPSNGERSLTM